MRYPVTVFHPFDIAIGTAHAIAFVSQRSIYTDIVFTHIFIDYRVAPVIIHLADKPRENMGGMNRISNAGTVAFAVYRCYILP
jgi:hypothetical protein